MESKKTYTVTIESDGDDLILPIPEELLEEMGWEVEDILSFSDNKDGTFSIEKL